MKKVFRLFISSTFEDFRLERAVLQKFVFPEIKKYLNKKELSFIPIDLRWGVPQEAQIDQRTMDICLSEVERATIEPHPDFLILSGDKYGWVPIPRVIEKEEFETIINKLKELNKNIEILEKWYELDENQIPHSYILKARDEITDKDYTKWENWKEVEDEIRDLLQLGAKELSINDEKKTKYFTSATHEELKTFLKHKRTDKNLKNHMFSFIRKFNDLDKIDKDIRKKLSDAQTKNIENFRKEIKTNTLKENLKESDVSAKYYEKEFLKQKDNESYFIESVFENINSLEEIKEKFEDKDFAKYLIEFGNFVKERLLDSLKKIEVEKFTEKDYQEDYKNYLFSRPFIGREKEIEEILKAIEENNKVLIYGESGIGKSVIMARVINELEKKNKVIYRFCGINENTFTLNNILYSIFEELKIDINDLKENEEKIANLNKERIEKREKRNNIRENIKDEKEEIALLNKELKEINKKLKNCIYKRQTYIKRKLEFLNEEIIIIIDAIDQLKYNKNLDGEYVWLNYNNSKIKIVFSVVNDNSHENFYYDLIKNKFDKRIEVERFENPKKVLEKLLLLEKRKLTEEQYKYVLKKEDSNKALYLNIAVEELKHWMSSDNLVNDKDLENKKNRFLSETQQEIIIEFFENLYNMSFIEKELIEHFLFMVFVSDFTFNEEEIIKLLSDNIYLMNKINDKYHKNLTKELPPAVWSRYRWLIRNFIVTDENEYIRFKHKEFKVLGHKDLTNVFIYEHFLLIEKNILKNLKALNKKVNLDYVLKFYNKFFDCIKNRLNIEKFAEELFDLILEYDITFLNGKDYYIIDQYCAENECDDWELVENIKDNILDLIDINEINYIDNDDDIEEFLDNMKDNNDYLKLLALTGYDFDDYYEMVKNLEINKDLKDELINMFNELKNLSNKCLNNLEKFKELESLFIDDDKISGLIDEWRIVLFIDDLRKKFSNIIKENQLGFKNILINVLLPLNKLIDEYNYEIVKRGGGIDLDIYKLFGFTEKNVYDIYSLIYNNYFTLFVRDNIIFEIEIWLKYNVAEKIYDLLNNNLSIIEIMENLNNEINLFSPYLKTGNLFNLISCWGHGGKPIKEIMESLDVLLIYPEEANRVLKIKNIKAKVSSFIQNLSLLKFLFTYTANDDKLDEVNKVLFKVVFLYLLINKDYEEIVNEITCEECNECLKHDEFLKHCLFQKYPDKIEELECKIDIEKCFEQALEEETLEETLGEILEKDVKVKRIKELIKKEMYDENYGMCFVCTEDEKKIINSMNDEEIIGDLVVDGFVTVYLKMKKR